MQKFEEWLKNRVEKETNEGWWPFGGKKQEEKPSEPSYNTEKLKDIVMVGYDPETKFPIFECPECGKILSKREIEQERCYHATKGTHPFQKLRIDNHKSKDPEWASYVRRYHLDDDGTTIVNYKVPYGVGDSVAKLPSGEYDHVIRQLTDGGQGARLKRNDPRVEALKGSKRFVRFGVLHNVGVQGV